MVRSTYGVKIYPYLGSIRALSYRLPLKSTNGLINNTTMITYTLRCYQQVRQPSGGDCQREDGEGFLGLAGKSIAFLARTAVDKTP